MDLSIVLTEQVINILLIILNVLIFTFGISFLIEHNKESDEN